MRQRHQTSDLARRVRPILFSLLVAAAGHPAFSAPPPVASHRVSPTTDPCLNFRPAPEVASVPTDCLAPGTLITMVEPRSEWSRVRLADGREGWVSSQYLDAVQAPPSVATPEQTADQEQVAARQEVPGRKEAPVQEVEPVQEGVPVREEEPIEEVATAAREEAAVEEVGVREAVVVGEDLETAAEALPAAEQPVQTVAPLALRGETSEPQPEAQRQRVDRPLALAQGAPEGESRVAAGAAEPAPLALGEETSELRAALARLEGDLEESRATERELWGQLEGSLTAEGRLRAELAAAETELSDLRRRLDAVEATEQEAGGPDEDRRRLLGELDALRAAHAGLQGEMEEARLSQARLEDELEVSRSSEARLEGELEESRASQAELRRELGAARAPRAAEAELRDALEGSRIVENDLRDRLEQSLAAEVTLEARLGEAGEREADLEARLAAAESRVEALQAAAVPSPAPAPAEAPLQESAAERESPAPPRPDEVREALDRWAAAWSEQRVEGYLAAYSREFRPTSGADRETWESQRRRRIEAPQFIRVSLDSVGIRALDPAAASARFTQTYESDTYGDRVIKVLDLVLEEGSWKISGERVEQVID